MTVVGWLVAIGLLVTWISAVTTLGDLVYGTSLWAAIWIPALLLIGYFGGFR